jgi:L-alanine-DL-glutamate epimerase-like enolase superfamily enzyme
MIPEAHAGALSERHRALAHVPLVTYGIGADEVARMARRGTRIFKIKLGQPGTQEEMLRKDMERLTAIHEAVGAGARRAAGSPGAGTGAAHSPGAPDVPGSGGPPLYYLDANGRYENKDTLKRLLDHLDRIGALCRVVLLEEPFPAANNIDVSDLPVTVAGDESVEGPEDIRRLAGLGYRAFAVKPAGKTLSASLEAARAARKRGLPCFVADSACVPLLVEWNKNVAARLGPLPGLDYGILESNGADHYRNWDAMLEAHPCAGASWVEPADGFYTLDSSFYDTSACVLENCGRYEALLPE